jgi:hypothetical protein
MKALLLRLWHSPTLMTWGSLASRLLGLMLVLPLVFVRFPAPDVAVWQLFATLLTLLLILDFGLSPTFSRMISYAVGGARIHDLANMAKPALERQNDADPATILAVYASMRWLYARLILGMAVLISVGGSLALKNTISQMDDPMLGWSAWLVVLATSMASVWANAYSSAIQGFNQIATLRRWEILTSLGQIGSSFLVLSLGGNLLHLIAVSQAWVVFGMWRNRKLLLHIYPALAQAPKQADPLVLKALWPATWRSGLGILMSQGIIQLSGIAYGQLASAAELASYLFALRVITTISQFSQAPFYSKLPTLGVCFARGETTEQLRIASKGMRLASWVLVAGTLGVALCMEPALQLIHSKVQFVSPALWALMSWAFFIERVGAMHIQLYSLTNHIIWHIANGVTGTVMLILAWLLYPEFGIAAFPAAMLSSYALIYTAYAMYKTSTTFKFNLFTFECKASLPAAAVLLSASGLLALYAR